MKTLPLSEVKMKLSEIVEKVSKTDEEVIITRNGRPVAVLVSADEFEGWKETIEINVDSAMMSEIRDGLKALKRSRKLYTLDELFN